MKKGKNQTLFTQRLLAQLSKFKDTSTIASGHLQIKSLLVETRLEDAEAVFSVLENDNSSERAKKQYIRVYTSMIEVYGLEILNCFERFVQVLIKKHAYPTEAAEVFAALAKLITTLPDEQQQLERLYHIQQAFQECPKDVFVGVCLRCIIKQLPLELLTRMEGQLCQFFVERTIHSKTKVQLIEALLSLLLALEENFEQDDLVRGLIEADIKNQDWNVRKSVIDLFYALLVLKGPTEKDSRVLEMVKEAKYDKIKTVRDAAANCLSIFKTTETQEKSTHKKQPMKPWKTQPIKPKKSPQGVKNSRNQEFFKKAKLENEIVISQPPQTSSIRLTEIPLDPLSKSNYQKRGVNDTIEQIQSMMPKGLSVAESMVFKYDQSKEFQEEKKMEQSSPILEDQQEDSSKQPNKLDRLEKQIRNLHNYFVGFQKTVVQRLTKLEQRVEKIEVSNFANRLESQAKQPLNNNYLIVEHPSRHEPSINTSKEYPHAINVQPYVDSQEYTKEEIKNFSQDKDVSLHQKILNQLQANNIQVGYEIAFTEGRDEDIVWLIQKTGMVIKQLDQLHGDLLIYKVRELISKGIERLMCLRWVQQYLRGGNTNREIQWCKFLSKIKCNSQEEQRIRRSLLELQTRVQ